MKWFFDTPADFCTCPKVDISKTLHVNVPVSSLVFFSPVWTCHAVYQSILLSIQNYITQTSLILTEKKPWSISFVRPSSHLRWTCVYNLGVSPCQMCKIIIYAEKEFGLLWMKYIFSDKVRQSNSNLHVSALRYIAKYKIKLVTVEHKAFVDLVLGERQPAAVRMEGFQPIKLDEIEVETWCHRASSAMKQLRNEDMSGSQTHNT